MDHAHASQAERFHPLANFFPLTEGEEFDSLVADIKAHGLREPIVLHEGAILDGRNRYRACKAAGVSPRFIKLTKKDGDPLAFVISKNLKRRHLDESQRAWVAAQIAKLPRGRHASTEASSQDAAADLLSVSRSAVQRATIVRDHGQPELQQAVAQGRIAASVAADAARLSPQLQREIVAKARTGDDRVVRKVVKQHKRAALERKIGQQQRDLPDGKFGVFYADPAWRFETYSDDGKVHAPETHYATMALDDIKALDVPLRAAKDSVLFLWATVPMLTQALEVMAAWGFEYVSHVIWNKNRIGRGYWVRNKHELLLIGRRGKIPAPAEGTQWPSVIDAPVGEPSAKPEIFAEMIERLFPTLPKLEMFRRGEPREDWTGWGAEMTPRRERRELAADDAASADLSSAKVPS